MKVQRLDYIMSFGCVQAKQVKLLMNLETIRLFFNSISGAIFQLKLWYCKHLQISV